MAARTAVFFTTVAAAANSGFSFLQNPHPEQKSDRKKTAVMWSSKLGNAIRYWHRESVYGGSSQTSEG